MKTLQNTLADIRELSHEELDLSGAANSSETSYQFTWTQYITTDGRTVWAIGDVSTDVVPD